MKKVFDGFKWGLGFSIGGAIVSWLALKWSAWKWEKWLKEETEEPDDPPAKKGYTKIDFNRD